MFGFESVWLGEHTVWWRRSGPSWIFTANARGLTLIWCVFLGGERKTTTLEWFRRICVTKSFQMFDLFHSVWHGSFIRVAWLIHTCGMTHSYVWSDPIRCLARLCYIRGMTLSYMWQDTCAFTCMTWHIHGKHPFPNPTLVCVGVRVYVSVCICIHARAGCIYKWEKVVFVCVCFVERWTFFNWNRVNPQEIYVFFDWCNYFATSEPV